MKKHIPIFLLVISLLSSGCIEQVMKQRVSDEVLKAFISLDQSLQASCETFQEKNHDTRDLIVAKVQEEMDDGNYKHEHLLEQVDDISKTTRQMLHYLDGIMQSLEELGEMDYETGELEYPDEVNRSNAYMMGSDPGANEGSGNGEGIQLRKKLETHINGINHWLKTEAEDANYSPVDTLESLVIQPHEDKYLVEHEPEKATLSWEAYTFQGKPVVANMATIQKYKLDVVSAESEQLNFLKNQLGGVTFKIDSLILVDVPESRVVAAGMKFETKLFVATTSKDTGQQDEPDSKNYSARVIDSNGDTVKLKGSFRTKNGDK